MICGIDKITFWHGFCGGLMLGAALAVILFLAAIFKPDGIGTDVNHGAILGVYVLIIGAIAAATVRNPTSGMGVTAGTGFLMSLAVFGGLLYTQGVNQAIPVSMGILLTTVLGVCVFAVIQIIKREHNT